MTKLDKTEGYIVKIDQKKAFKRVSQEYLWDLYIASLYKAVLIAVSNINRH